MRKGVKKMGGNPCCIVRLDGSAWEWYYWIVLEKDINQCRVFFIHFFYLEYLIRVQSSEPLNPNMIRTSYLFGSLFACAQPLIFSLNCAPKRGINCSLDYGSWVKNSNIPQSIPKKSSTLADFFNKKSALANMKTGIYLMQMVRFLILLAYTKQMLPLIGFS